MDDLKRNKKKETLTVKFSIIAAGASASAIIAGTGAVIVASTDTVITASTGVDAGAGANIAVVIAGIGAIIAGTSANNVIGNNDIKAVKKWLTASFTASALSIGTSFYGLVDKINDSIKLPPEAIEIIAQGANKQEIEQAIAPSIKSFVNNFKDKKEKICTQSPNITEKQGIKCLPELIPVN